jgi:hypothetical protein
MEDKRRRRALRAAFEWWWNLDRRPRPARSGGEGRRRGPDQAHVVAEMARELEEIRNLPELV